MEEYIIISYATKNQKYLDYTERLINFFLLYNINNYHIRFYDSVSSKMEGCLLKPSFILDELLIRKHSVLCIDIDSIITDYPYTLLQLENTFDIGFVFTPERKNLISNGIHIFNYTTNTISFLNRWNQLCKDKKLTSLDHHRLIDTYYEYYKNINIIDIRKYVKDWIVAQFSFNNKKLYF